MSSYPYLHLARKYGVPYRVVLEAAELFALTNLGDIQRFLHRLPFPHAELQAMPRDCQRQILKLQDVLPSERHLAELDQDLYDEMEYHLHPVTREYDVTTRKNGFVSACCEGERCGCGRPARHKVEEVVFFDDPLPHRHPLTTYVCEQHFDELMHRS